MQKKLFRQAGIPVLRPWRAANEDQAIPRNPVKQGSNGWDPYQVWRTRIKESGPTRH